MIGTTIITDTVTPVINQFNTLPLPIAKRHYKEKYYTENELIRKAIFEDDDKICLTVNTFTIIFNTKFIPLKRKTSGLTYDKHTRKIKLWIGTKITTLPLFHLFNYLNIDWIDKLSKSDAYNNIKLNSLLANKTVVEKIINGKITCPKNLIQCYLKTTIKYNYHWKLVRTLLNISGMVDNINDVLVKLSKYSVNPNESLRHILKLTIKANELHALRNDNGQIIDGFWNDFPMPSLIGNTINESEQKIKIHLQLLTNMLEYYGFLEEKMNFKWSQKRSIREYKNIKNTFDHYEALTKNCNEISYIGELLLPAGAKLLCSENMYFTENLRISNQLHYRWSNIVKRNIFAISFLKENKRFVAIVVKRNGIYQIGEIVSRKMEDVTENVRLEIHEWCSIPDVLSFFKTNGELTVNENRNVEPLDIF